MEQWKFSDPPNLAVITNRKIVKEGHWIAYVSHDSDDGGWQFHCSDSVVTEGDATVVSLRNIVQLDPSVTLLADLPLSWHAWRDSKDSEWRRAPMSQ